MNKIIQIANDYPLPVAGVLIALVFWQIVRWENKAKRERGFGQFKRK